jgi:hypothetical protein
MRDPNAGAKNSATGRCRFSESPNEATIRGSRAGSRISAVSWREKDLA